MSTMDRYSYTNENPLSRNVGDCTVRAISTALGQDWGTTYIGLCVEGYSLADMPSSNAVWGSYLRRRGWRRSLAPDDMTVLDFARSHPRGTYLLALSSHVVCVDAGEIRDTWNSGGEIVLYYWKKG